MTPSALTCTCVLVQVSGTSPIFQLKFVGKWGRLGGGYGRASTANSTRAILPPILDIKNSKGRLPPTGRLAFDSHLRTPITFPASS